jgi:hypothetical protein
MPNKDISEEFTDSTYTANGRICIIQNGPKEICCIYIHMRQLWFTGSITELGRMTEFCEWYLHAWRRNTTPILVLSGEA